MPAPFALMLVALASMLVLAPPSLRASEEGAAAWILIAHQKPALLRTPVEDAQYEQFVRTQIELLTSPVVLGQVASQTKIKGLPREDPATWLAERTSVTRRGESELFVVRFKGQDAAQSSQIVDAILAAYLKLNANLESVRRRRLIDGLEKESERISARVDKLREEVRQLTVTAFEERRNGDQAAPAVELEIPEASLRERILELQMDRDVLEAKARDLQQRAGQIAALVAADAIDQAVDVDSDVQQMSVIVDELREKMAQTRAASVRGERDPLYQRAAREHGKLAARLESLRREVRDELLEQTRGRRQQEHQSSIESLRREIEENKVRSGALSKRYLSQLERERSATERRLDQRRRALADQEGLLDQVQSRINSARSEELAPSRIIVLKRAEP